jgi:hypothetical protein
MASSIPPVLDALVALVEGLPVITEATDSVEVSDGPIESTADVIVTVGGAVEPTAEATFVTAATRGQAAVNPMDEDYVVSVDIDYLASTSDQKLMRDRVFAIWDAISDAVRADRTLGGVLVQRGGAEPTSVAYHQTPPEEAPERVRSALINGGIRIRNRI